MAKKTAVIIGAGPAGLTAALELLDRTEIKPVIIESDGQVGGISKTIDYKGNRIDIGGHRFFSKSDRIVQWWLDKLPLQGAPARDDLRLGRSVKLSALPGAPDPEKADKVMLVRRRISRIFAFGKFFDYPISMHLHSLLSLGLVRLMRILASYLAARIRPIRPERTLEDFFINRFGRELYQTFFKKYTQKVWGLACSRIDADWGAQRIQGVSIWAVIVHAVKSAALLNPAFRARKDIETSLIDQFMYPKFGPGQLWEEVARRIKARGGEILLGLEVTGIRHRGGRIEAVEARYKKSGEVVTIGADYCISSMPVRELVRALGGGVPDHVKDIAEGLQYRSFITVGLLMRRLKIKNRTKIKTVNDIIPDNWIYMQDRTVKLGRLQVFNNWSPYLVRDENTVWLGLEYFCNEGDYFWKKADEKIVDLAVRELTATGFINGAEDVIDNVVIRMPKAYPVYYGTYDRLDSLRHFTDTFENLFLIGRNGMHRYNNTDHSMMTAIAAVDNIAGGVTSKDSIWKINTEAEYHEQK